MMFVILGPR